MAARCIASILLLAAVGLGAGVSSSGADLTSRYQAGQAKSSRLRAAIRDETSRIGDYQGTISSLQARLSAIERSVSIQQALLASVDRQLAAARARLAQLQTEYNR